MFRYFYIINPWLECRNPKTHWVRGISLQQANTHKNDTTSMRILHMKSWQIRSKAALKYREIRENTREYCVIRTYETWKPVIMRILYVKSWQNFPTTWFIAPNQPRNIGQFAKTRVEIIIYFVLKILVSVPMCASLRLSEHSCDILRKTCKNEFCRVEMEL